MTTYFISRHQGAIDWAQRGGIQAQFLAHLNPDILQKGDMVIATLPCQVIEQVQDKGARYIHLALSLHKAERGQELSANQLQSRDIQLIEYTLTRLNQFNPSDFQKSTP